MYEKVYVTVEALFGADGNKTPLALYWDGKRYDIDKVSRIGFRPPVSGGILTEKYDCLILGRTRSVYFETHSNKWFIETLRK